MRGEIAPFTGQLLTTRRAAILAVKADSCTDRMQLAVDQEKDLGNVQLTLAKAFHANDLAAAEARLALVQRELDRERDRSWYGHPAFVIPLTVLATAALLYGSAQIWGIVGK